MKLKIPHSVLKRTVDLLEKACCLFHPLDRLEIKLLGGHCKLALLSLHLDEKWGTGRWEKCKPGEYYPEEDIS
jgi:hypothetical protein